MTIGVSTLLVWGRKEHKQQGTIRHLHQPLSCPHVWHCLYCSWGRARKMEESILAGPIGHLTCSAYKALPSTPCRRGSMAHRDYMTCPGSYSLTSNWLLSISKVFIMWFLIFVVYEIMGSSGALVYVRQVLCKMSVEYVALEAWKWLRLIQPWLWRLSEETWGNTWVIPNQ